MLRCSVRPEIRTSQLILNYRPAGTETFTQLAMPRRGNGTYEAVVPASATAGKSLQFFVETGGPIKASNGSAESPNLLIVKAGAPPIGTPSSEEGAGGGASLTASSGDTENPLAALDAERALANLRRRPRGRFWVGLGVGTAYGWQPGGRLEFRREREIGPGGLPGGLLHLMPEFGYQLLDRLSVSLQARLQYAPSRARPIRCGQTGRAGHVVAGACDVHVPGGSLPASGQPLLRAATGSGCGSRRDRGVDLARSDTVRGRPADCRRRGWVVYHFARRFAVPLEARVLYGFPVKAFAFEAGISGAYTFDAYPTGEPAGSRGRKTPMKALVLTAYKEFEFRTFPSPRSGPQRRARAGQGVRHLRQRRPRHGRQHRPPAPAHRDGPRGLGHRREAGRRGHRLPAGRPGHLRLDDLQPGQLLLAARA